MPRSARPLAHLALAVLATATSAPIALADSSVPSEKATQESSGHDVVRFRGLNLPPTQGTTRDGAFFPGLYSYTYEPEMVKSTLKEAGFTSIRLGINLETAMNLAALQRHKAYIDAMGGRGIICMFDTSTAPNTSWPRPGRFSGMIPELAQAWRSVHGVFGGYGSSVVYELFNEPWGYQADAVTYVAEAKRVIQLAELPVDRVVLAGLYGSADVQSVARAGWQGLMAYHCYSFWLPEGQRTREKFAAKIEQDITGLADRIFITEFGVGLDVMQADMDAEEVVQDLAPYHKANASTSDWLDERPKNSDGSDEVRDACRQHQQSWWCRAHAAMHHPGAAALSQLGRGRRASDPNVGADVAAQQGGGLAPTAAALEEHQQESIAFLGGLRDALRSLRTKSPSGGVRGLFHWHGWHNGDTWDFWDAGNAKSSRMIQLIMSDLTETPGAKLLPRVGSQGADEGDDFLTKDFVTDEQLVNMVHAAHHFSDSRASSASCPAECHRERCIDGNIGEIGGKLLTGSGVCVHNCSITFNGMRYCGVGAPYSGDGVISCGACASPPMCGGLPCWDAKPLLLLRFTEESAVRSPSAGAFLSPARAHL